MKICWDNIENIRLTKKGNFRDITKKSKYYYWYTSCNFCKEPFFGRGKSDKYCCNTCARKDTKHTEEHKEKISESLKGIKRSIYTKKKMSNSQKGNKHCNESKKKMSIAKKGKNHPNYGKHLSIEVREKISKSNMGRKGLIGNNNPMYGKRSDILWKGGYNKRNIPFYNTYVPQLEWCEEVRRNEDDPNVLEVKCFKCGKWYVPTLINVQNRLQSLKGIKRGESHFYCSDQCKNSCSIYGKSVEQVMKQDAVRAGRLPWLELTREVQPELREMVLERDKNRCVKCGSSMDLQCHHILPITIEPLLSADVDNCITLCYTCHKKVHQEVDGCGYGELRIGIC